MKNIKTLFFDFDGVIVESAPIRIEGFRLALDGYPDDAVDRLVKYHVANGGISRFAKFEYFFETILGEPANEETVQKLAADFSKVMRQQLADPALLIPETMDFIRQNPSTFNFHVISGSEETELQFLCKFLGISEMFLSIRGSPTPKNEVVGNVLSAYGYDPLTVAYVGDAINDHDAARLNGISFFGFNNDDLISKSDFYIRSYAEFSKALAAASTDTKQGF